MPRQPLLNDSAESRAIQQVMAEDDNALKAIALEAGPPDGARKLSENDEDDIWAHEDPMVAAQKDQLAQQLATQGLPPQVVQGMLVAKLRPDWAPIYAQPTNDLALAQQYIDAAHRPFRWSLLEDLDPPEQVKRAEHMDRRYQRRLTKQQEQAAEDRALQIAPVQEGA